MTKNREMSASHFKSHCSQVIEEVSKRGKPVVITKRGKPIAMLMSVQTEESKTLFGFARGFVKVHGDILEPIDVERKAQR